jgi:hypothetical protein
MNKPEEMISVPASTHAHLVALADRIKAIANMKTIGADDKHRLLEIALSVRLTADPRILAGKAALNCPSGSDAYCATHQQAAMPAALAGTVTEYNQMERTAVIEMPGRMKGMPSVQIGDKLYHGGFNDAIPGAWMRFRNGFVSVITDWEKKDPGANAIAEEYAAEHDIPMVFARAIDWKDTKHLVPLSVDGQYVYMDGIGPVKLQYDEYVHAGYVGVSSLEHLSAFTQESIANSIRLYNAIDLPRCITTEVFVVKPRK